MATYEDFLSRTMLSAPGCPEPVIAVAVQDSVIEFCEKSRLWLVTFDPMTAAKGQYEYDFDSPEGARVVAIERVWFKGRELAPQAPEEIQNPREFNTAYTPGESWKGDPRFFYQRDLNEQAFSVFPIPDVTSPNALTVRASLKPTRAASSLPDFLYEDHVETISAGALSRIMLQPEKAYSNAQLGAVHATKFLLGLNNARLKARRGNSNADLQVRLRRSV